MKKILYSLCITAVLYSCNPGNDQSSTTKLTETIITPSDSVSVSYVNLVQHEPENVDPSITKENAYSDLFIDSNMLIKFISQNDITQADAIGMKNFYKNRSYQYAWFNTDGLTEQGRGFWSLYSYDEKRSANKLLKQRMDTLAEKDTLTIASSDSSYIKTELSLTKEFMQYARLNPDKIFTNQLSINQFVPAKKQDALILADTVLTTKTDTVNKSNSAYGALKQHLLKYSAAAKQGGWQPISLKSKLKKGVSSPLISSIKKRMQITGDYSLSDTSRLFNDSLEIAVKSMQQRMGFTASGIINDSLIKELNVPVAQRIEQIMINMNRMLWLPATNSENHITVNVPEFLLKVYEGNAKAFDMNVIVGKQGSNTMMFYGDLNQIVFSPYWNIPTGIVRDELMPAMKKNPNYLKSKNIEITGKKDSLPTMRQLPGAGNSLGQAKFLFPNSYDIYFHDTDAKSLFNKRNRALSHGCIRLQDAQKMAQYLLRNDASWPVEKINEAMNSGKEQWVRMKNAVPVTLTYFTAWVDENGLLNFRDDVYGKDKQIREKMFEGNIKKNDMAKVL